MVTVSAVEAMLYAWAPKELAFEWDNVGLLVGDGEQEVERILVALDITEDVAAEAIEQDVQLIVAHHPVMNCAWHEVQTLREDDAQGKLLRTLVKRDISAICMHTNLDAAEGGVNDCLAQKLQLLNISAFNAEKIGRIGRLKAQMPLEEFLPFVVKSLGCNGIRYISADRPVEKVMVGGGACRDYIAAALENGCDTFVTSDLKYNDFLDTKGLNLIDAGHFPTEQVICAEMADRLRKAFPQLSVLTSERHNKEIIQYYT